MKVYDQLLGLSFVKGHLSFWESNKVVQWKTNGSYK